MSGALRLHITLARVMRNFLFNLLDPPVLVLTYHRVTTLQTDPQLLAVTPVNFRAQLQYLINKFPLVRFEDDWSGIRKPAVAITFDDGYSDNVLEALPILERVGAPATFFISTGAIGTINKFWWDELERIVLGGWTLPERFALDDDRFGRTWPTRTVAEIHNLYETLLPLMKTVDAVRRDRWFLQLRQWAQIGEAENRTMTVDELHQLGRSKWATIGAHTITHTPLSSLSIPEQRKEIEESKMQLESWTGQEVKVFSYPYGLRCDYTGATVDLCRKAGFTKAAANFPGQWHRWTDPYQIPRLVVRNWPMEVFIKHLRRFWIL